MAFTPAVAAAVMPDGNGDSAMLLALWIFILLLCAPLALVGLGVWASTTLESPREY
jgi:hypothetical protein